MEIQKQREKEMVTQRDFDLEIQRLREKEKDFLMETQMVIGMGTLRVIKKETQKPKGTMMGFQKH